MAQYIMNDVKIEGSYLIRNLLELTMDVGVNRHGTLTYGGYVSEDDALRYIQQSSDMQIVSVSLHDELEFCGYVQSISAEFQNELCYLRVTLSSSSSLMGIHPRDRFFQDVRNTYEDIITEAFNDSNMGHVVAIRGKERIMKPILQYRETDWQFAIRMAGRLCTVVIPDVLSPDPQILLGVPKRRVIDDLNCIAYTIRNNSDEYMRKQALQNSLKRYVGQYGYENSSYYEVNHSNFISYEITSDNRYKLGDSVRINGSLFIIMQKNLVYEKGEIREYYTLGEERGFAVPFHQNKRISGLELEGKVIYRYGQRVIIILDIDADRRDCEKTWFNYSPPSNNGMYSMPLKDEKAMLQWQSEADEDVLVVRPVRKDNQYMPDPGRRHFLTEHDNHLMMVPDKVEYTNPVGSIKWLGGIGFDISTGKNLNLSAGSDISIKSKAQVRIYSPERITVCKTGIESSIDMLGDEIHVKAERNVKIDSKINKYRKIELPERDPNFTISLATASKLAAAAPQMINAKK